MNIVRIEDKHINKNGKTTSHATYIKKLKDNELRLHVIPEAKFYEDKNSAFTQFDGMTGKPLEIVLNRNVKEAPEHMESFMGMNLAETSISLSIRLNYEENKDLANYFKNALINTSPYYKEMAPHVINIATPYSLSNLPILFEKMSVEVGAEFYDMKLLFKLTDNNGPDNNDELFQKIFKEVFQNPFHSEPFSKEITNTIYVEKPS